MSLHVPLTVEAMEYIDDRKMVGLWFDKVEKLSILFV